MGGGTPSQTNVYTPQPAPQPSTADAINQWVESMPAVFAEQQRQAPLQAQLQVDLAQQYAPLLGAAAKAGQEALYPETSALQETLAGQAAEGLEAGVPDWMRQQYRSDLSANIGSNVGSGIGADYVSRGLLEQSQNYQNYYRNLSLSLAGRQPLAQPTQPQTGQYAQGFQPGQGLQYSASTYGNFIQGGRPINTGTGATPGGVNLGILGRWGG